MTRAVDRPAFYAGGAGTGGVRDWLTLLFPPYAAWHLSYVAFGAALARHFVAWRLRGRLLAFFLAVGVGAHATDELAGRRLQTGIPAVVLAIAAGVGVAAPVVAGLLHGGIRLLPFIVVGAVLVLAYDLELGKGILHNAAGFAPGWSEFPVFTGYAQDFRLGAWAVIAAVAAFFLSLGQRALSAHARTHASAAYPVRTRAVRLPRRRPCRTRPELTARAAGECVARLAYGLATVAIVAIVASRL